MAKHITGIVLVFVAAAVGWSILGTTIMVRTDTQDSTLKSAVGQLWGKPLEQRAPVATLAVKRLDETEKVDEAGKKTVLRSWVVDTYNIPLASNRIQINLHLEQRKKGLLWYATYRVRFSGDYTFENSTGKEGSMSVTFAFPACGGLYDEFVFLVDGIKVPVAREGQEAVTATIPATAGARHTLSVGYVSQGMDAFVYKFSDGIGEVRDFQLVARTDFDGFDFPGNTISPTQKLRTPTGWDLTWKYTDLIAGSGIGVEMPHKLNPGPLAARISFFAPVSLGFFFFLMFVISMLKGVRIHAVNYFFLAAAFFAFHLLLAYLVDHISIHLAFVICSAVSLFLVASYLRLVVGARFAFVEATLSQLVYLVGFSYAFFFEGFTGLAVTIGSIVTLFVVMQATARLNWSERFAPRPPQIPLSDSQMPK